MKFCFRLSCRGCILGVKGLALWIFLSVIYTVIVCSMQHIRLFQEEAGTCSSAKIILGSLQSPHWRPVSVCHSCKPQCSGSPKMLHQLISFSEEFISLSDAIVRKMFITLMEKGRKQPVSQGLVHKKALEEEFVYHCRQKLLMLFLSPSLGYKWDLERGTERIRKKNWQNAVLIFGQ